MKTIIALMLTVVLAAPASAQFSLGWNTRNGTRLAGDDVDLLLAGVAKLNGTAGLKVGDSDDWSNPKTGSYGSAAITSLFQSQGLSCHGVHHEIVASGQTPPTPLDTTWCLAPDGKWKMKN